MSSDPFTILRLDRSDDGVAEVVLNNPDRLNAMSPAFFEETGAVFTQIDQDPQIRCAILWAEGRMFTAGLDLKSAGGLLAPTGNQSAAKRNLELLARIQHLQELFSTIQNCSKPVIAAVHGHCIGGGVDLTTSCDMILCTEDATFSIQETKIAIIADLGTLQRLGKFVGKGIAREMALTGNRLDSGRALQTGLVNQVFADKDALLAGAREMARQIAANSPLAVQGTKMVLNYSDEHSIEEGLKFVALWNAAALHTNDLTEAITAFMQKRPPNFKGD